MDPIYRADLETFPVQRVHQTFHGHQSIYLFEFASSPIQVD